MAKQQAVTQRSLRWEFLDEAPPKTEDEIFWAMYDAWAQWRAHSCVERNGRHNWMLEIESGAIGVSCSWCSTPFHVEYQEEWAADPIPVKIRFEGCGQMWHGLDRCDCGWWWVLEPRDD